MRKYVEKLVNATNNKVVEITMFVGTFPTIICIFAIGMTRRETGNMWKVSQENLITTETRFAL